MTDNVTVCWTEIPVSDLARAQKFYENVFGWEMSIDENGPNPMVNFSDDMNAVSGHLYQGKPAAGGTGATVHLVVPDLLEDAMKRCKDAGGQVVSRAIEIPPGRFAYAEDLDGNSIGLFESKAR